MEFDLLAYNHCSNVPNKSVEIVFEKPKARDKGVAEEIMQQEVLGFKLWLCVAPCSKIKKRRSSKA